VIIRNVFNDALHGVNVVFADFTAGVGLLILLPSLGSELLIRTMQAMQAT
jgi:hypothetical protein